MLHVETIEQCINLGVNLKVLKSFMHTSLECTKKRPTLKLKLKSLWHMKLVIFNNFPKTIKRVQVFHIVCWKLANNSNTLETSYNTVKAKVVL